MFSPTPFQPTDLGVILSYQCQSRCAHCLYNCGPEWRGWMSREVVRELLQAALAWEGPLQVHFTGGEPFLNFPLLLEAVETAAALGIPRYVETNAGWCLRAEQVRERFQALQDAGLQAVLISCSPFHAASIPLERTLLAVQQAREVFGPHRVMIYRSDWIDRLRPFGVEAEVPLERLIDSYGRVRAGWLLWQDYGLISGGRAGYQLGTLTTRRPASAYQGETCRNELLFAPHSHFDLYGNFISGFCGGLAVGSWRELPQVLAAAREGVFTPLVSILLEAGPYGLYEFAASQYGYLPPPGGYAGKCHLCVDVRQRLHQTGLYPELQPEGFYLTP